jgi:hypothetical protein
MSDYDLDLAREILRQILWSAQTITKRFEPITAPDDFIASEEGLEKLDAISMQLIALGENVKNLDRAFSLPPGSALVGVRVAAPLADRPSSAPGL